SFGGAIDASGATGVISSCTFVQNVAYGGGAIVAPASSSALHLGNSIFAGNVAFLAGPNISGLFISDDYNVVDNTAAAGFNPQPHDLLNISPKLGSLED